MNIRILLLACFCFCTGAEMFSQVIYVDRRFWHDDGQVDVEQPLVFDVFPYTSPMVDMRGFMMLHPEIADRLPEWVEIVPPELEGLTDLGVAMAWIGVQGDETDQGQLILIFVGHNSHQMPRFYVDRNLDRAFVNDGPPVIFTSIHLQEKISLKKEGAELPTFEFMLLAPAEFEELQHRMAVKKKKVRAPDDAPEDLSDVKTITVAPEAKKEEVASRPGKRLFDLRIGLSFGVNRISYEYLAASSGFPVNYEVTSSNKGLFINGNFRKNGLRFGIMGGLEHIFWWSSYKTTRFSDPFEICVPNTNICSYVPGVEVETNKDRLPTLRLNVGLNLEYLFRMMNRVRIGPYLSPAVSTYRPSVYVPKISDEDLSYKMGPDFSFEGGVRLEVQPTDWQAFVFSCAWTETRFRPVGYFEAQDIRIGGLFTQNRGLRAYFGYSILL